MRRLSFLLLPVLAGGATVPVDPGDLAATITALTAPALAGRGAGTAEEREAAALVASWLAEAGLVPGGTDSAGWFQEFPLPATTGGDSSLNVVGSVPGGGDLQDRWIIVGAHLDHLGRVDPLSTGIPAPSDYYPGAGDNASGIAVLRQVARAAAAGGGRPGARRSLLVCAFGAEEIGLLGSAWVAANSPVPLDRVDAMVNLDAVGRLGAGPLYVAGVETCPLLAGLLEAPAGDLVVHHQDPMFLRSDHLSFLERGIPALFLFTSAYPEMNSPADSLAAIDLEGLARVAGFAVRLVEDLRETAGPFSFSPPAAAGALPEGGNRQTWLGTVPDFGGADGAGYVVGDVVADGPAQRAGLRAGDVILQLGGEDVHDLAGFTAALRRHDPGDVVEVRVQRAGRSLGFYVRLGDRSQRPR